MKDIGIFPVSQDVSLYRTYSEGIPAALKQDSDMGDNTEEISNALGKELVRSGPFSYKNQDSFREKQKDISLPYVCPSLRDTMAALSLNGDIQFHERDPLSKKRVPVNSNVFVIDSPAAHELDDGISIEECSDGIWLHIHIADPTAYIPHSHMLSNIAQIRSTSVYLPHIHFPMMPDILSKGLLDLGTSLGTITFSAQFNAEGELSNYKVTPTLVSKTVRISYADVDTVLDGDKIVGANNIEKQPPWIQDHFNYLKSHESTCSITESQKEQLLKIQRLVYKHQMNRVKRGGFTLDGLDHSIHVQEADTPLAPKRPLTSFDGVAFKTPHTINLNPFAAPQRSPSQTLVSESMIIANRIAAKFFSDRKIPGPFRGQLSPRDHVQSNCSDQDVIRRASELTEQTAQTVDPISGTVSGGAYRNLIKYMGSAYLRSKPIRHWALGVEEEGDFPGYIQVTSPLRRYLDMTSHYQIQAALLDQSIPFDQSAMDHAIQSSSKVRRQIKQLQKASKRYWALEYLRRISLTGNRDLIAPEINGPNAYAAFSHLLHPQHSTIHTAVVTAVEDRIAFVDLPYLGGVQARLRLNTADPDLVGQIIQTKILNVNPDIGILNLICQNS